MVDIPKNQTKLDKVTSPYLYVLIYDLAGGVGKFLFITSSVLNSSYFVPSEKSLHHDTSLQARTTKELASQL